MGIWAFRALMWTRKAHIPIHLNLILGYIGEDEETLEETISFVRATLPETLQISTITPKPGTEFTRLAVEKGWSDGNSSWKKHLTESLELVNYGPFNLDLDGAATQMNRTLYRNPKWWLTCTGTLLRNRYLVVPAIKRYLRRN